MQKAAPTGTSAFLIGGETLHAIFNILTQRVSAKKEVRGDLNPERLRDLQQDFKDVHLLFN